MKRSVLFLAVLFALSSFWGVISADKADAVTAADWRPGRIIDDVVFQNKYSMTVQQIQQFLDSKVPVCDTWGTKPMWAGGPTRAQWSIQNGREQAPYTCLKEYRENPVTKANNAHDPRIEVPGGLSAAQLIYNASQAQNINPQVFLVLLQKEQSLVTDDWPYSIQFERATGNNCPDTAPCNPTFAWLWTQVNNAGAQFNYYVNNFNQFNYAPGWNSILYHPNAACGRQSVFIENRFTAALYIYTPYVPNQAALNNMYGTGDACSAYCNRNFWRLFNDWFGSSIHMNASAIRSGLPVNIVSQPVVSPAVGQHISYTVSFRNDFASDLVLEAVGVVGRAGHMSTGGNRDFGWQGPVTIPAGQTREYTFTTTILDQGAIYIWPSVIYQGNFVQYNNWGSTLNARPPSLSISEQVPTTSSTTYNGQEVTFSAKITNTETFPVKYDALGIPVRYGSQNYDAAWSTAGVLGPGESTVVAGVRRLDKTGSFSYWIAHLIGGKYWTLGQQRTLTTITASPSFSVSAISLTPPLLVQGQPVSATFNVTNNLPIPITVGGVGVVGRYNTFNGLNRDIGWQGPVTFAAGETKAFSGFTRTITETGPHHYWVGILSNGNYLQYNNWGMTAIAHAPSFSVSAISLTPPLLVQGQPVSATFNVTNNLPIPITVGGVGVVGRYNTFNGLNRDIGWQGPVTFAAGETKAFSGFTRTITETGPHHYWVGILSNGNYLQYNNWGMTAIAHAP